VPGESCALHGIGWQRSWRVVHAFEDRCALELILSEREWPFGFRATQAFNVAGPRFSATIAIENTSRRPIPAGLGFHPYFVRTPGMALEFQATRFWLEGPGYLPTDAISLPAELDFTAPKLLPPSWRNNCYSGWNGCVALHDPARGLQVTMQANGTLKDLMLYTPPKADYFCLEPQSHTTGAVTKARAAAPAEPLRILQPAEWLTGEIAIVVSETAERH
jgi:aldose 1-epimerase